MRAKTWRDDGQATVESAFLIPVLFTALLLLVQPGMVLYDRMVMAAAATDACRVLAVKTDAAGDSSRPSRHSYVTGLARFPRLRASTFTKASARGAYSLKATSAPNTCACRSRTGCGRCRCSTAPARCWGCLTRKVCCR